MEIRTQPDMLTKLALIGDATQFEPAGDQPQRERAREPVPVSIPDLTHCVVNLATPRGPKKVLKTMMTTACERNCFYCPFRAGRAKTRRVTFSPDEMAAGFEKLQRAGQAEGLFLSSGIIKGSVTTQDRIISTAELVRERYRYEGYLHLKIMPGIQKEQLYRVMQLADRVSVNLEAPTQERLAALAPKKEFLRELLGMLELAEQLRREHPGEQLARTVTQFVVGAVGDTDSELLRISQYLYRALHVRRAYYSGFAPVEQTPFEQLHPTSALREQRLYQASFLLRDYGWSVNELTWQEDGNLRLDLDPKRVWAEAHLREAPIDLMTASRAQLLHVPGFGPHAVDAILRARRQSRLREIGQLRTLRIAAPEQAAPYILLDGRRPPLQMHLF